MAIIEIGPGRYISHVWFLAGDGQDFMGAVWRDEAEPENTWHLTYRFRYYAEGPHVPTRNPFNGEDEKSSYGYKAVIPEAKLVAIVDGMTEMLAAGGYLREGRSISRVAFETSDVQKAMGILAKQPWAHIMMTGKGGEA